MKFANPAWWLLALAFAAVAAVASPNLLPPLPPAAESMRPLLVSGLLWTRAWMATSAVFALVSAWALKWNGPPEATPVEDSGLGLPEVGVIIGLTLLALLMRLPNLGDELWWDELNSLVRIVRRGVVVIFAFAAEGNNHSLNTWGMFVASKLFGEKEWALRLPSLLLGSAMPAAAFLALRSFSGRSVAILAGTGLALHFRAVVFSDEARGYMGTMFFAMLASCLFVTLWRRFSAGTALLYVLCCALASGYLVLSLYMAAGHFVAAVYLASHRKDRSAIPFLLTTAWAGVMSVMVNVFTLPQIVNYSEQNAGAAHRPMNWELFWTSMHYVSGMESIFAAAILVAASVVGWYLLTKIQNGPAILAGIAFPAIFQMIALTLQRTKASPRLFVLMIFPLMVGVAYLLAWLWNRRAWQKGAAVVLGASLLASSIPAFQRFYGIGNPDLRGLAGRLIPDGTLLLAGAQGDMNGFYFPGAPWVLEAGTIAAVESRRPGYALLGEDCQQERFSEAMAKLNYRRVERLEDWTAPELSKSQRRPCFVLYQAAKPK